MSDFRARADLAAIVSTLRARVATLERGSIGCPVYTIATLPAAADVRPGLVFVSDAPDGQRFQGSDGTNWKTLG